MLRAVVDLLYPPACPGCGELGGDAFCDTCRAAIAWIRDACARCALPHGAGARCPAAGLTFDAAASAALYDGAARDAILRFKLGGERRAARAFAATMSVPDGATVTFVPTTRRSLQERGFNPAEAIARALAGRSVRPLLRKVRDTPDQAGLTRSARAANLSRAFTVTGTVPVHVLLVDDILTTGATADACARALKAAGARSVAVATFARTP